MKKKNLLGQRFTRLVVINSAPSIRDSKGRSVVMWHCKCDCGNEKNIRAQDLLSGDTKSCGCYNLENAHKSHNHKTCYYNLSGDYGVGTTQKGDEFWFDKEDYDLIKDYCWFKHGKYYVTKIPLNPNKEIFLHRLIMGVGFDLYDYKTDVDHIKTENKFDNRKSNLRIVTKAQNNTNKIIQSNNKSGCPGVTYHKRDMVWEVTINIDGKRTYIGRYKNKDDAIKKRRWAENKYYGEYSYLNSQLKGGN